MAWDFSTDPDFQEKLDWMDEFVREEIEPMDLVWDEGGVQISPGLYRSSGHETTAWGMVL